MNHTWIQWIVIAPLVLGAGLNVRAAALSLEHTSIDGGGGRASSESYTIDAAFGPLAGAVAFGTGITALTGFPGQLNEPPVAGADTASRAPGMPLKFFVPHLLANDSDAEGGALSLALAGGTSLLGAAVYMEGAWIFYMPNPNADPNAPDSFEYILSDGFGGSARGTVSVLGASGADDPVDAGGPPNLLRWERVDNTLSLVFAGIPGAAYKLQFRETVEPASVWADYPGSAAPMMRTASATGLYQFTIAVEGSQGFFRSIQVRE